MQDNFQLNASLPFTLNTNVCNYRSISGEKKFQSPFISAFFTTTVVYGVPLIGFSQI